MSKMHLAILSYTDRGAQLARSIGRAIEAKIYLHAAHAAAERLAGEEVFSDTAVLLGDLWDSACGILFISAAGIAVRSIAPFIKSKESDPAVLCMDEGGRFVIPLLSGHLGGANELAEQLAKISSAQSVITTATDGRGIFAVDIFAKKNGLVFEDVSAIRHISSELLSAGTVGFVSELAVQGGLPEGLIRCADAAPGDETPACGIVITRDSRRERRFLRECRLYPKNIYLGVGCKKDTDKAELISFVEAILAEHGISPKRIVRIASIELKKQEAALHELADKLGAELCFYTADALNALPGTYHDSDFVLKTTGVGNVCERSAMCAAGCGARLLVEKLTGKGMTLAVAETAPCLRF